MLKLLMLRRLFAVSTICALLALHLGLACLAVARTHAEMPMNDTPCEAGATAQQKLLCAAPSAIAAPTSQAPEPIAAALDALPVAEPPSLPLPAARLSRAHGPAPPKNPPAFLLHHALLI